MTAGGIKTASRGSQSQAKLPDLVNSTGHMGSDDSLADFTLDGWSGVRLNFINLSPLELLLLCGDSFLIVVVATKCSILLYRFKANKNAMTNMQLQMLQYVRMCEMTNVCAQ